MLRTQSDSRADVERLWRVVSDLPAWDDLLPTFTSITQVDGPEPINLGSRFAVVQPGLAKAVWVVTAWEPGHGFTWEAQASGVVTTASHTVERTASGSRLTLALAWSGPLAGPVRLLLTRRAQAMIDSEAAAMAAAAEADE